MNTNNIDEINALKTIKEFLKEGKSVSKYCKKNYITVEDFNKCVDAISKTDIKLFNKYRNEINNNIEDLAIIVNSICESLRNGIDDGNKVRKMDIIDYYELCTLSFPKLLNNISSLSLSEEDVNLIEKFIAGNKGYDKTKSKDINEILAEKVIISDNYVIPRELKISIMEELKEKKIPINRKTYTLMFRRNINNYKNKKTLIKK